MTIELWIGSYGYRYSDPYCRGTVAGLTREAAENLLDRCAAYEAEELPEYCELDHDTLAQQSGPCSQCEITTINGVRCHETGCPEIRTGERMYPREDCSFCNPDIVTSGVWPVYHVSDVGGLRNAIAIIRECRESPSGATVPDCLAL